MARSGSYTLDQMRNNRENMKRVEGVMGSYTLDKQPCFFCVQRGRAPWISLGQQWKGAEKNYVTREVFIKALDDAEAKQEKAVIRRNNDKLLKTINLVAFATARFSTCCKSSPEQVLNRAVANATRLMVKYCTVVLSEELTQVY